MAHLKNAVTGTEIEVDDDTAQSMTGGDGWEVPGDGSGDNDARRRKAPRKGTDA